ncbi:UDP-galactose transporter [Coemansia spiralis]|uniref:UDP-galactose transporter homolog 1 n=2 Tax=Coemansia TaxID=4863 RepID=A0A9W8GDZ6_9FUNG|nr:UAA transporter family-domain-containing protein [Coemansia spiralis]KAJ1994140.1 UDP-galactose transporter [Coemansia umbellata]KAJ2623561.1 UDP-galactose transporter [Coemansia sp. RSA 1358]KAJ2680232.1 UDP-galactose transporter [Coemansia spiralis]
MLDFIVCVGGIYVFFLSWSTLQERVTSAEYGEDHQRFRFTIVLNTLQAIVASAVGYLYIHFIQRKPMLHMNGHRWKRFFQVAFLSSSASPFGYMALQYINYPTMTLAKTCKMVPVMMMNKLLYRRHYPTYKYAVVAMVTVGVSAFMLFKTSSKSGTSKLEAVENSMYGLFLVLVNLAIDGAVNSTQDQVFAEDPEITGQHMMCMMNVCSTILMGIWLLNPFNPELASALRFLYTHPRALIDIGMFSFCGAMGQCFVFYTLAKFGSLTLTTVTVTRKFLTILISVFYNGHKLNARQWSSTGLVFAGITLDVYKKQASKKALLATATAETHIPLNVNVGEAKQKPLATTTVDADADQKEKMHSHSSVHRRTASQKSGRVDGTSQESVALDSSMRRRRLVDVTAG